MQKTPFEPAPKLATHVDYILLAGALQALDHRLGSLRQRLVAAWWHAGHVMWPCTHIGVRGGWSIGFQRVAPRTSVAGRG